MARGREDRLRGRARAGDLRSPVELRTFKNPLRGPKGTPRRREAVERDRAMFPADQLHQLFRHGCSDHKRETIAFGRRIESILGRAPLMAVWKSFIESRSERRPDRTTAAIRLGLTSFRWGWEQVPSRRLFPEREGLSGSERAIYERRWTPRLAVLELRHAG